MKTDTLTQMDPGVADPIGTKAEVKAMRLPLLKYATCSLPGRANRGCRHFDHPQFGACPVRVLLAKRGRPGPENVAVLTIKGPTQWKQDGMPCTSYMDYLAHMDEKIALHHIIGIGGDKSIKRRTTVQVDPTNKRGGATRTVFEIEPILKFPRPNESMAERAENMNMIDEINRKKVEVTMEHLSGGTDEMDTDDLGDEVGDDDFSNVDGDGVGPEGNLVDLEDGGLDEAESNP